MVSAHLQGGLGNYMFQISTAHSLALDHDVNTVFEIGTTTQVHKHISEYIDNIFRNVKFGTLPSGAIFNYVEKTFDYTPIEYQNGYNMRLNGYFQSEKYFKHHREELLSFFSPSPTTLNIIHDKYGSILSRDSVCSIHVRRGDYLKLKDHHPTCDMTYYTDAMDEMSSDTTYLIFSDDIEWCKENFIGDQFIFVVGENDVTDLWLMSYCSHNIIANSSFSWWGAWLNDDKDKIVVAPSKWFGPAKGNTNTDDIYAKNWVKI